MRSAASPSSLKGGGVCFGMGKKGRLSLPEGPVDLKGFKGFKAPVVLVAIVCLAALFCSFCPFCPTNPSGLWPPPLT